jgi:hypothetical protein
MAELHVYAEATERMKSLTKDNNDGLIQANKTTSESNNITRGCWNCGSLSHIKANCPKPPSLCGNCKKRGHIDKFCRTIEGIDNEKDYEKGEKMSKTYTNNNYNDKNRDKKLINNETRKYKGKKKVNHKSEKNKLAIQKAKAFLAELEAEDDNESEDDRNDDDDENHEEQDDIDAYLIDVVENDNLEVLMSNSLDTLDEKRFIVDSGCKGAHITTDERLLINPVSKENVSIRGITGHSLDTSHSGILPTVEGRALCVPKADANLLSLKLLVKDGGRFEGDNQFMKVYNKDGDLMLHAYDQGDGYWSCSYRELKSPDTVVFQLTTNIDTVKHYSPEEKLRVKEAFQLC